MKAVLIAIRRRWISWSTLALPSRHALIDALNTDWYLHLLLQVQSRVCPLPGTAAGALGQHCLWLCHVSIFCCAHTMTQEKILTICIPSCLETLEAWECLSHVSSISHPFISSISHSDTSFLPPNIASGSCSSVISYLWRWHQLLSSPFPGLNLILKVCVPQAWHTKPPEMRMSIAYCSSSSSIGCSASFTHWGWQKRQCSPPLTPFSTFFPSYSLPTFSWANIKHFAPLLERLIHTQLAQPEWSQQALTHPQDFLLSQKGKDKSFPLQERRRRSLWVAEWGVQLWDLHEIFEETYFAGEESYTHAGGCIRR